MGLTIPVWKFMEWHRMFSRMKCERGQGAW
jgi:hypothetical protein